MGEPFDKDRPRHSVAECAQLLERILVEPEELLDALAPDGWEGSPLRRVFHPTPEQRAEERARFRRNLEKLRRSRMEEDAEPPPEELDPGSSTLELPTPDPGTSSVDHLEPESEVLELLGCALWDVFSDNHTVVGGDGTVYDLGTFRGSGGFIAESINRRYADLPRSYGYLDFYMGSSMISGRADLRPVYRWIFSRLEAEGCRWIYSFPRFYLVEPRMPNEEPADYDPSEAVRREIEQEARAEEVRELQEQFDRWYEEAVDRARHEPPPETVAAYEDVFGAPPEGWPYA